jgi:O-antigen/teichoic acid export membrane protein
MFKFSSRSSLTKSIFTLITGTTIAQLIPFLLQPLLRRLFSVEVFGMYSLYLSIVNVLTIFVTLRFEQAIVIPENENQAKNLIKLTFLLSLFFNAIILLIFTLFLNYFGNILGFTKTYYYYLFLIPVGTFLLSFYETLNYYLIRKKKFRSSSINKISRRSSEGIVQLSLGFLSKKAGLIIGDIFGNIINVISALFQLRKSRGILKSFKFNEIKAAFKRFSNFPKFQLIPSLLSALCLAFPIFYINKFYDKELLGIFDLSRQVLSIPLVLISTAIGQVLFQNISESIKQHTEIKTTLIGIFKILLFLIIIEVIIIILWGPWLFSIVFGNSYYYSGEISQILVFCYVIRFISTPFSVVLICLEKLKINGIWQILYFAGMYTFLWIPKLQFSVFIYVYVAFEIIAYISYLFVIIAQVNKYEKQRLLYENNNKE